MRIDHPPKHLVDGAFMGALVAVLDRAERDDAVHVLVFESADPDFFMMHGDVEGIMRMPHNPNPATEPNPAEAIFERVRRFPKPTIGMIDGHARGGGSEFLSALDMRFAGPRTVLGQPEVPMGILPGAGGTQFLARLVGRARALEIIKLPDAMTEANGGRRSRFTPAVIEGRPVHASPPAGIPAAHISNQAGMAVPLMGRIAAGVPIEAIQHATKDVFCPPDMVGKGEHFALEVNGDSKIGRASCRERVSVLV